MTEAKLADVSGGATFENILISGYNVVGGTGGGSSGSGSGFPGWDLTKNKGV
jgi:hypothetical protein